ncbi:MAG: flagellar hook protein FlgE [Magnetospirillum sp. WYHS-4]
MSLSGILSSAVSGLTLNASRVAASADNLANVHTVGHKAADVQGATLVTRQASATAYSAGGVRGRSRAEVSTQGLLQATSSTTDLAIAGQGFFAVQGRDGGTLYTRAGSFKPDSQGYLVNAQGFRLLGRPTDAQGQATGGDGLVPVNLKRVGGTADATTRLAVGANLPADAPVGDSHAVIAQARDSLGNPVSLSLTFTKTGANQYDLSIADPAGPVAGMAEEGGAGGGAYAVPVTFGSDGRPDGGAVSKLFVGNLSSGAADLSVDIDLEGLTQFGSDFVLGRVETDGAGYGTSSGATVGPDGTVMALFENGERRPIYRVSVATFGNPEGLESLSGNVYRATEDSGAPTLRTAGEAEAGTVEAGALEQSTVDIGGEMVRTILARTAYSFNLETLRAADEMQRELLDTKA